MNTIYTVAIGSRHTKTLWARDCLKAWERYCDRHNLNLHVQTKATYPFREHSRDLKFEKFNFIHQDFDGGILVVDIDTVPVPDMPNVFDLYSDRNITCRVNPEWGPGHHFFLWSQSEQFDDLFTDLSWPRFGDVNRGGGPWPKPDVWFYVSGGLVLLPPNARRMFAENYQRIKRETPLWNAFNDEVIWSWWIARFNREYNLGVDAFEAWRWTPYPSARLCTGEAEALLPDCHMVHLSDKKYLSYYYTEWYILNSAKKTLAGAVLYRMRRFLSLFSRLLPRRGVHRRAS